VHIRYILGRSERDKTNYIFNQIKSYLTNTEYSMILLVPEQFTLQSEIDIIKSLDKPGIMRIEVLSFRRLAYKVFNEVGGLKKVGIDDLGKLMILRRLFDEHSKELKVYQKAYLQSGFLSSFSDLIKEFKRNDISPQILRESVITEGEESILKRKMDDIVLIYEAFSNFIQNKYTDEEDKFNLLIELMEKAHFLENTIIWVDGFSGFSEQEYRILEKLLIKSKKLNIALTLDDLSKKVRDKEVFEVTDNTFKKLREIAKRYSAKETKTIVNTSSIKNRELQHLEREFFSYPYNIYPEKVDSIELFSALNQYTEIERVACRIVSLVRDKGFRWKDIALVNNSMETYGLTIKRVFTEYGIPFFIDEKRSIMNNPIIKLILSSLDIINRHFRYEDVFKFIKTGFTNFSKDEYEILENYVLKYGIEGNKWFKEFIHGNEDLSEMNRLREEFISPFVFLKEKIKGKNKVVDISTHLFQFLELLEIEEKLDNWITALKRENNIEYANENTQIWNIVVQVFDQLVEILGETVINLRDYSKILEAGFSDYKVGIIPPTIDQVLVGTLDRSRSHDIKALFIVGVNDGIIPSNFSHEGLLLDDEKITLKEHGIPIQSDCGTKQSIERFSIYTALSKPREYLWISYALSDNEGKAQRPSILIDRFKRIYPNIKVQSDVTKSKEIELISRPLPTVKYLIENLRLKLNGYTIDEIWKDVYEWYCLNEVWNESIKEIVRGLFHNNQEKPLGEDIAKRLYNTPLKSSISRLESFVNCPFSHFINYGLKPKERKEYKISIPDIGIVFHEAMDRFSKELTLQELDWKNLDKEKCEQIIDQVVDKIADGFQNNIFQSSNRYKYLVNKLKRISKRVAWTLTEHIKQGDFVPLYYEVGFGDDNQSLPPIVLELPNGEKVVLEGRIDRIDILKDNEKSYVKIIDYKSGNNKFNLSDVYHGLQIQLIVYLDAVMNNKELLRVDEVYPGGVFYFKLHDPMIESNDTDIENIEREIMKQLKMDGLVLKDVKIAKSMDNNLEEGNNSSIIPVSLKKDRDFSKFSSVLDTEDIQHLIKHVRKLIIEIAEEILKGNIKVNPCKVDNRTPCQYCKYNSICQFDRSFENNNYRIMKKLKDDEIIERLKKGKGGEGNVSMD